MRKRAWMLLLPVLLLTGCATAPSSPPPTLVLPTLVDYPPDVQRRAADELDSLPADSILLRMMRDYGDLRARIRAAKDPA